MVTLRVNSKHYSGKLMSWSSIATPHESLGVTTGPVTPLPLPPGLQTPP